MNPEALLVTLLCVMCSMLLEFACHSAGCRSKLRVLSIVAMLHFAWALSQRKFALDDARNVLVVARSRHVNRSGDDWLYFFDVSGLSAPASAVTFQLLCKRICHVNLAGV